MKNNKNSEKRGFSNLSASLLLLLLAIVCVAAVTTAWISVSDHTRLSSMGIDVSAGPNLRFDLDRHESFDDYALSLSFGDISARIQSERGFNPAEVPLDPVTTEDYVTFTKKDGAVVPVDSGSYLEFTVHFIANRDCVLHLTSADSSSAQDGTKISSSASDLPAAMRIGFFSGGSGYVYDAGVGNTSATFGGVKRFGLPGRDSMTFNDNNALFSLKQDTDLPIIVRIWLEGTDEACNDSIQNADYRISLRFEVTDNDGNPFTHGD